MQRTHVSKFAGFFFIRFRHHHGNAEFSLKKSHFQCVVEILCVRMAVDSPKGKIVRPGGGFLVGAVAYNDVRATSSESGDHPSKAALLSCNINKKCHTASSQATLHEKFLCYLLLIVSETSLNKLVFKCHVQLQ